MQVVFMDSTPDMLPDKIYENFMCNNSEKQAVVYLEINLYDKILLNSL